MKPLYLCSDSLQIQIEPNLLVKIDIKIKVFVIYTECYSHSKQKSQFVLELLMCSFNTLSYWFTKMTIPGEGLLRRQYLTRNTVPSMIVTIIPTEITTAMIVESVSPQSEEFGCPHFPFLQQLFPQSSLLEHVMFSQLSKHNISSSLPQHCSSHIA